MFAKICAVKMQCFKINPFPGSGISGNLYLGFENELILIGMMPKFSSYYLIIDVQLLYK